jgi:hypothetical protein
MAVRPVSLAGFLLARRYRRTSMARDVDLIRWWQELSEYERLAALDLGDSPMPGWMTLSLAEAGVTLKGTHRSGRPQSGVRVPPEVAAFLAEQF